ncbi:MAG: hypothetical protein ACE5JH_00555 [Acidobacteriota bacterium]
MTGFEIVLLTGLLVTLLAILAVPLILAFALVAGIAKFVIFLLLLPFRVVGWCLGVGLAALGLLIKGVILTGLAALLFLLGLAPVVPVVIVAALIYLLVKAVRLLALPAGA